MNKKIQSSVGLFLIFLIISMPIYSANAMAATVEVTKNTGVKNINGFLDSDGDTWTVEALVKDAPSEVAASSLSIRASGRPQPFTSCSSSSLGTTCSYSADFSSGIDEGSYPFTVAYSYTDANNQPQTVSSTSQTIKAEGSGPQISGFNIRQGAQGKITAQFTVTDQVPSKPSTGLEKIEVVDRDTNTILLTINENTPGFTVGQLDYSYNSEIPLSLTGEGIKRVRVLATDRLGHIGESITRNLAYDFSPPGIESVVEFDKNDRFIGTQEIVDLTMSVYVTEKNEPSVSATSQDPDFEIPTSQATCSPAQEGQYRWKCSWSGVDFKPKASVSFTVTAIDKFNNKLEATLSKSNFAVDSESPTIEFFGLQRSFNDQFYVSSSEENKIILKILERGSGIDQSNVELNLGAFSTVGAKQCNTTSTGLECFWSVTNPRSEQVDVSVSKLVDNVGNEGSKPTITLMQDGTRPVVNSIAVSASSSGRDRNYFQSRDHVKLVLNVTEESGLLFLFNVNDLVNDAQTRYPQKDEKPAGWMSFDENDCTKSANNWICTLITDEIKSGPDSRAEFELLVSDTAGNRVSSWPAPQKVKNVVGSNGKYSFELSGLSEEPNPDFWQVRGKAQPLLTFVDLDATELGASRIPVKVTLTSSQAHVLRMEVTPGSCSPKDGESAPEISDVFIVSGASTSSTSLVNPTLMIELAPFNGREFFDVTNKGLFKGVEVEYTCNVNIFSSVGATAHGAPEIQPVSVKVLFAFSDLGALDENLGKRVEELRSDAFFKIAGVLSTLNDIIKWLKYVANILSIITSVAQIVSLVTGANLSVAEITEESGFFAYVGAILRAGCLTIDNGTNALWKIVEYIQIPVQILACNPTVLGDPKTGGGLSWYGKWQKFVLTFYNTISGRGPLGLPAKSLYDNLYISVAGICVPGILFNVQKAREISCRRIVCYGEEVPKGVATIAACEQLYDLQMCEYFFGPVVDLIPLLGVFEYLGELIQSLLSSPAGLIVTGLEMASCLPLCFAKDAGVAHTACRLTKGISIGIGVIETVLSAVSNPPSVTGSPYCAQAEKIDVSKLTGGVKEEEDQKQDEDLPSAPQNPPRTPNQASVRQP